MTAAPTPFELNTEFAQNPLGLHTLKPRFGWQVPAVQTAYRVRVASSVEALERGEADKWDSGWVAGDRTVHVAYQGKPLRSKERCYWTVTTREVEGRESTSSPAFFEMGLLDDADWGGAEWIGVPGLWPGHALLFRHAITPKAKVTRARLYITGLGLYRAYLNGRAVSDRVLDPPPTDVERIVPYTVFDITHMVKAPETILAVMVGHGWYGRPILKLRLEVDCEDGSSINTVSHWDMNTFAVRALPISDGIFKGEDYDARLDLERFYVPNTGWKDPLGARENGWTMVYRVSGPGGRLVPDLGEPMRVVEELTPTKLHQLENGAVVFDAGTNLAGYCRLRLRAPEGHTVTLRFSETLKDDGSVSQDNLYVARAADVYTAAGRGEEVWEPKFTYHGFRYVQAEGLPPAERDYLLTVCRVQNDLKVRGEFACGDPTANAIHQMIVRTERSNEHGVLTDCPQRSERQGWLNDQTARAEQVVHNFVAEGLLAKWLRDFASVQDETGAIPDTVPWHWGNRRADPVCVCPIWYPWLMWRHYGDARILEEHWPMMTAWQRCLASEAQAGILDTSWWGDWCPPRPYSRNGNSSLSAGTPGSLVSTAHLIFMTRLLEKIAEVTGKAAEARRYAEEREAYTRALLSRFFDREAASFGENIQATGSLALWMGLVPKADEARVFARVAEDVETRGHLTTGNVCTKYLLEVLADYGRADLAWRLIQRKEYPSWGYMLDNGATTMWERWENETGGGMNSHNHCMLGAVDAWFYTRLVGIREDEKAEPGDAFVVRPHPVPGLDFARGKLATIRGILEVEWVREAEKCVVRVELPVGSRADLEAPIGWKLASGTSPRITPGGWEGTLEPA